MMSRMATDRNPTEPERAVPPRRLNHFIGQNPIKEAISIASAAARQRGEAMEHVLLCGPRGMGKKTLAAIIATELDVSITSTSAPLLKKTIDLTAILSNIRLHQVLLFDEIDRAAPALRPQLQATMRDFRVGILVGAGPGARMVSLPMPKFTLVGTAQKCSLNGLSAANFGLVLTLSEYTV